MLIVPTQGAINSSISGTSPIVRTMPKAEISASGAMAQIAELDATTYALADPDLKQRVTYSMGRPEASCR